MLCLALGVAGAATAGSFKTSDGVRLHYREEGASHANTVILVPGWTMPGWIWDGQVETLKDRYHVIAFDPRGQGESEVPEFGYARERRARDLSELIDHLDSGPVVLVGWSLGALEVLAHVATVGDGHVAGVVLVDNSIGEEPAPQPSGRRGGVPEALTAEARAGRRAAFVDGLFAHDPGPEYRARLTRDALRMRPDQEQGLLRFDVPRSYWREAVYSTGRPVLYVVRPRWQAQGEALVRTHADAELVVMEGAGHALFVDAPGRFNALLLDFLDRRAVWTAAS